jgi:SAM-dependent methyltransferase
MGDADDWGTNFAGSGMDAYENSLVQPLFVPWAEHLIDRVGIRQGDAVLDVACGPGTVSQIAARRVGAKGSVVGCDLSEEMLSIARAKGAASDVNVDYRRCSAEALSVDDDSFDVALCQQGLQFFPDRVGALVELRRALRDGGQVGVSVWCEIEACEPFAALEAAIAEVLGPEAAAGYRNGPWGYCDPEVMGDELRAGGFSAVEVRRDEIAVTFADPDHLIRTLGAAPVWTQIQELDSEGRERLRKTLETAVARLIGDGAIRGITTCHTATGTA